MSYKTRLVLAVFAVMLYVGGTAECWAGFYNFENGADGCIVGSSQPGICVGSYTASSDQLYFVNFHTGYYDGDFKVNGDIGVIGNIDGKIAFDSPAGKVSLLYSSANTFTMDAYDASNVKVGSARGPANVGSGSMSHLEINHPSGISYIIVKGNTPDAWIIDDLSITPATSCVVYDASIMGTDTSHYCPLGQGWTRTATGSSTSLVENAGVDGSEYFWQMVSPTDSNQAIYYTHYVSLLNEYTSDPTGWILTASISVPVLYRFPVSILADDGGTEWSIILGSDGSKTGIWYNNATMSYTFLYAMTNAQLANYNKFEIKLIKGATDTAHYYVNGTKIGQVTRAQACNNAKFTAKVSFGKQSSTYASFDARYSLVELRSASTQASGKITGHIDIQNYMPAILNSSLYPVKIDLIKGGSIIRTEIVVLDANGNYTINTIAPGTYDIGFQACKWLRKIVAGVVVNSNVSTTCNVSLINGDTDGDNEITTTDLGVGIANMDANGL